MEVDPYATIVPGKSLGGFSLLDRLSRYLDLLRSCDLAGRLSYELSSFRTVKYAFKDAGIEVNVDVQSGLIYRISAIPYYHGKFLNMIGVGISMREVTAMNLGFEYDHSDLAFFSDKFPGIALEPDLYDPFDHELPNVNVGAISVFDHDYIIKYNSAPYEGD